MSEGDISRLLQQILQDHGEDVMVTGWVLVWEGQSIEDARNDEYSGGHQVPDGQSPALTLGLLEQGRRNAVGNRRA